MLPTSFRASYGALEQSRRFAVLHRHSDLQVVWGYISAQGSIQGPVLETKLSDLNETGDEALKDVASACSSIINEI